jgi:hypothetical protein
MILLIIGLGCLGVVMIWMMADIALLQRRVENLERDYMQHLQEHHGVAWGEKYESD